MEEGDNYRLLAEEDMNVVITDLMDLYGYDFSQYSRPSLRRRLALMFHMEHFSGLEQFRLRLRRERGYHQKVVEQITVNVTEMFRDPAFFQALRSKVLPVLSTYPFIKIWHAGCATGEEVYSMAILLQEAGLLEKTLIYATDLNAKVLDKAKHGVFSMANMKSYQENYRHSGGAGKLSDYYEMQYDQAIFSPKLRERMVFSLHNLVSDGSFNEFQLIVCRNVLIYFDKQLQERVLDLFDHSLERRGFLALGTKETIRFGKVEARFKATDPKERIWRKNN